jgi:hypothetical protein
MPSEPKLHIHRWGAHQFDSNHPDYVDGEDPIEEFDLDEATGVYDDHYQYFVTLANGESIEIRIWRTEVKPD